MRTRVLVAGTILLCLLAVTGTGAATARTTDKTAKAKSARIDLATYNATRWIVQLRAKPLARYPKVKRGITYAGMQRPAKINFKAKVNRRYLAGLARRQRSFAAKLR